MAIYSGDGLRGSEIRGFYLNRRRSFFGMTQTYKPTPHNLEHDWSYNKNKSIQSVIDLQHKLYEQQIYVIIFLDR